MTRVELDGGWDSAATVVDGIWLERRPRRPEVEPWLRTETRLLPVLAPRLPLPVPVPEIVGEAPLVVRHRMLSGTPMADGGPAAGRAVGDFLRVLHAQDPDHAVALGVPGPERAGRMRAASLHRFRTEIAPMLPADAREPALALCDRVAGFPIEVLVHGDLGPEHVLVVDGRVTGVIDWSDARISDPAKDLAWVLHGAPSVFADGVAAAYRPSRDEIARAADWYRLGPFYEIEYGLDTGRPALVTSGREGVVRRLATASGR